MLICQYNLNKTSTRTTVPPPPQEEEETEDLKNIFIISTEQHCVAAEVLYLSV